MASSKFLLFLFLSLLLSFVRSDGGGGGGGDDLCHSLSDGSPSCPINCFRADPVCGVNGITYWCGCPEAACAGVRVAKRGFCQVDSGGTGQALLLVHIVWLIVLGFSVLFGLL